jgi:HAD superfamily hydrolase (TIGR01450 family)
MTVAIADCSTFIFDLDGTVYFGNHVYQGAKKLLQLLNHQEKQVIFLSNNSTDSSEAIQKKLIDKNLPVQDSIILAATDLAGNYLLQKYGKVRVKTFGTRTLENSIISAGHITIPVDSREPCDVVLVGRDPFFTYQNLHDCTRTLLEGAKLVAVNSDLFHPGVDGSRVPETGALIAAIQAVTGQSEYESIGKPNNYSFNKILEQASVKPELCVMIGDNPYTDIRGGYLAGMLTVWISHKKTFPKELEFKPDVTVSSIGELVDFMLCTNEQFIL